MSHAHAMRQLRDLWPEDFPDAKIKAMAEQLAGFDAGLLNEAVDNLSKTQRFRPRLSELTEEMARIDLALPLPEAWDIFLTGDLKSAAAPVQAAAKYVGGRKQALVWSGDSEATIRAQFRKAYESLSQQAVRDYCTNGRALPAGFTTPQEALSAPMRALPPSERIRPRPVVSRLLVRLSGAHPEEPTEEEKHDAILVLAEGWPEHGDPDPVYLEAERIHRDADPGNR